MHTDMSLPRNNWLRRRADPIEKPSSLIADATREGGRARDRLAEVLEELHDLGIECLDPIQGIALVPFANEKQLAWFVYDLFDNEPLRSWRLHNDPLDTRRPIETIKEESA